MGLFKRNEDDTQEQERRPANPSNFVIFRLLAVGYLLWSFWQMVQSYMQEGEEKPSLTLMIVAAVILVGGAVWIAWITWRQWKRMKAEQADDDDEDEDEDEDEAEEETQEPQRIGDVAEEETE